MLGTNEADHTTDVIQEYETCTPPAVHSLGYLQGLFTVAHYMYHLYMHSIYYNNTLFSLFLDKTQLVSGS